MMRLFYTMRAAASILCMFAVITGAAYPAIVTGIASVIFPHQSHGSLIVRAEQVIGSELIGQSFTQEKYFWGRPSAAIVPYDPMFSGGSNLGVNNPLLLKQIQTRITTTQKAHPHTKERMPVEMVTMSASGLDPHISLAAARYQMQRVARVRKLPVEDVGFLVDQNIQSIFKEGKYAYVNVLTLNIALDELASEYKAKKK